MDATQVKEARALGIVREPKVFLVGRQTVDTAAIRTRRSGCFFFIGHLQGNRQNWKDSWWMRRSGTPAFIGCAVVVDMELLLEGENRRQKRAAVEPSRARTHLWILSRGATSLTHTSERLRRRARPIPATRRPQDRVACAPGRRLRGPRQERHWSLGATAPGLFSFFHPLGEGGRRKGRLNSLSFILHPSSLIERMAS